MSNSANQLGGKCPYMPYLGRGQMSGGEHVLHSCLVNGCDQMQIRIWFIFVFIFFKTLLSSVS